MPIDRSLASDRYRTCCRNKCGHFVGSPRPGCDRFEKPECLKREIAIGYMCDLGFHDPVIPVAATTWSPQDRIELPFTIVIASDARFLRGVYATVWSVLIRHTTRIVVYDLGIKRNDPMVDQMKSWGVEFKSFTPIITDRPGWQTFNKPWIISDALDSNNVLWLDCDIVVGGSLAAAGHGMENGPFVPDHGSYTVINRNPPWIHQLAGMPVRKWGVAHRGHWPCACLIGICQKDRGLIDAWIARTEFLMRHPDALSQVLFYDQGILQDVLDCELAPGDIWNNLTGNRAASEDEVVRLATNNLSPTITHFGGPQKPWRGWSRIIDWGDP